MTRFDRLALTGWGTIVIAVIALLLVMKGPQNPLFIILLWTAAAGLAVSLVSGVTALLVSNPGGQNGRFVAAAPAVIAVVIALAVWYASKHINWVVF
jgi:hypothetical protein